MRRSQRQRRISYDQAKREWTLANRELDFEDAVEVFAGPVVTIPDRRRDYGEDRFRTFGYLDGRMVVLVWTPRGAEGPWGGGPDDVRRVISMRKANAKEQARIGQQFGETRRDDG